MLVDKSESGGWFRLGSFVDNGAGERAVSANGLDELHRVALSPVAHHENPDAPGAQLFHWLIPGNERGGRRGS